MVRPRTKAGIMAQELKIPRKSAKAISKLSPTPLALQCLVNDINRTTKKRGRPLTDSAEAIKRREYFRMRYQERKEQVPASTPRDPTFRLSKEVLMEQAARKFLKFPPARLHMVTMLELSAGTSNS